jgi:hypothetical protein|tara:strand:+ start:1224 stop:1463 length:240 start_codon:yes stop_codon:yes gene_type:complete
MDQKIIKISEVMQKVDRLVKNETKNPEDVILVASALLAVTRNIYVSALGIQDTARMFEAVADSFVVTEEFMEQLKPTIH